MSEQSYKEIRDILERMLKIEYDSGIEDMKKTYFFIDDEHDKLIIKNYDKDIEIIDCIDVYFKVIDYEIIQYFQIGYCFNEFELVEFSFDLEW